MCVRTVSVLSAAVVGCACLCAPAHAPAKDEKPRAAAAPDLSGSWRLDKARSDDAHQKVRELVPPPDGGGRPPGMGMPGGPGMGGGGRMGPPPGLDPGEDPAEARHAILDPAEQLAVYQGETEIVIDERSVRRRTLHADGRKYKAADGASEVKAEWKQGRLVVETRGFRGRTTTETWALSEGGRVLTCAVKLETGFGPAVTIRRVYDRAGDGPAPVQD
ncbi:MAG TPA: hypothetical protein VMX54_03545 [Vicinamibacteria bacterium]|nr:hypothetical protein [Vicinamibacteria bacterium]